MDSSHQSHSQVSLKWANGTSLQLKALGVAVNKREEDHRHQEERIRTHHRMQLASEDWSDMKVI